MRERRERERKRLAALNSGMEMGEEMKRALALAEHDLPAVMAGMDRERFEDSMRPVLRRVSAVAEGGPRNQ